MDTNIKKIFIFAVIVGLFITYAPLAVEAAGRVTGGLAFPNALTLQRGSSYQLTDHIKYREFRYFKVPMVQGEQIPVTVTNPNEAIGHDGSDFISIDFHPEAQIHFMTPDQGLIVTVSAQGKNKSVTHYLTALGNGFGERANPTGFRGTKSSSNSDYLYIKLGNNYDNNTVSVHRDTLLTIGGSSATPAPAQTSTPNPVSSPPATSTATPTTTTPAATTTPSATLTPPQDASPAPSETIPAVPSTTPEPSETPDAQEDENGMPWWLWLVIILLILLLLIFLIITRYYQK